MQGPFDYSRSAGWQKVQNNNASQVPPRGVMRITGTSILEEGDVCFTVDQPNSYGDPGICLINTPTSVQGDGGFGAGRRDGILIAQFDPNDGTPAFGQFWGPRNGTWLLKKNTPGFLCLGAPTNTDQNRALFAASPMTSFYGKNTGSQISAGSTGSIEVFTGTFGSETDASISVTVLARFGVIAANAFVQVFVDQQQSAAVPQFYALQITC